MQFEPSVNKHSNIIGSRTYREDTGGFGEPDVIELDVAGFPGYGSAANVYLGIKCKANVGKITGMDRDDYACITLKHAGDAGAGNHIAGAEVTGTTELPLRDSRLINFSYSWFPVDANGKIRFRIGRQIRHNASRPVGNRGVYADVVFYLNGQN